MKKYLSALVLLTFLSFSLFAEDGHQLWLRAKNTAEVNVESSKSTPLIEMAKKELKNGWQGQPGETVTLKLVKDKALKGDGFKLSPNSIEANTEAGILYGAFELLRRQQTGYPVKENEVVNPSYDLRLLNHWNNLNGTIERGYGGNSIFFRTGADSLTTTPEDIKLWTEYARANASIGINGAAINNVNASPLILTEGMLGRVKDIADVFRTYGMKMYLSINFASPQVIGGLSTSDPLEPEVVAFWKNKIEEIYQIMPDFGGFLVKANSEGQPGPQDFGRTHVDGANLLADALKPYGGVVMWRAFVYSPNEDDRAKQAYLEFMPFDGKFRDNVIIQVKNGPVDFQPREPFTPLFGGMTKTAVMPELQITQEYFGHSVHLVFLATMWEEFLNSDTYAKGKGSTVARCTDGTLFNQKYTAIAGVSNIGLDTNWTGHDFAQANWYAYGRQAWNNTISSEQIADEWLKLTFENATDINGQPFNEIEWNVNFLDPVKRMMLESHEACVNYMMPLGLHHIFAGGGHYGPGPWNAFGMRPDWTATYYHQADENGIGFDRTKTGSNAVSQYHEPLASQLNNIETCPEELLLWFHHVSWDYKMKNGRTLWDELCYHYDTGVKQVREFQKTWDKAERYVDAQRFGNVQSRLRQQSINTLDWKDGCLLYFQQFSKRPIPYDLERPMSDLKDIMMRSVGEPIDWQQVGRLMFQDMFGGSMRMIRESGAAPEKVGEESEK